MTQYKKRWGYMLAQTKYPGIFRNQKGGFLARARVTDPTGKQREILKALDMETELEALQWLDHEKDRVRSGVPKQQKKLFSEFAASLYERKLLRGEIRSKAGQDKWRHTLTHLIGGTEKSGQYVQGFGDCPATEIRAVHVESWKDGIAQLIQGGLYAPTTINGWMAILRVISKAIGREYETRDFMLGVQDFDQSEWVTYSEESPNTLKPEDVPRFLGALKERWPQHYAMALLGFVTGLRPSSLRPLRRQGPEADVLWSEGRLLVRRSEVRGGIMQRTKTGLRYSVHLPEEVMTALRWHVDSQLSEVQADSDLLFPNVEGGFRAPTVLNKPFADIADHIGLGYPFTQRGMRRTFQDLARQAQVLDIVTRSVSGHATEAMQAHYSTVHPDEQRASLTRVFRVIEGGSQSGGGKSGGTDPASGGKKEKAG